MRNAMILAAGRGERMRPLTDTTPKPLLIVKGKPLIAWHLEALRDSGFKQVTINVAHLATQIMQALGDGSSWGLSIRYSEEPPGALETAGGIARAKPWKNHKSGQPGEDPYASEEDFFLVINGDVFSDWDPSCADQFARDLHEHRGLCHLVMVANPSHHPKGDFSLACSPGPVLALGGAASMTYSGIGIYHPQMFKDIAEGSRAALAPLIHDMIRTNRCRGSVHHGVWSDVGTPERLAQLNQ